MRPVRAVAWDVDGTLVDSEPLHERCLLDVCAALGAEVKDLGNDRFRGIHMADIWLQLRHRFPPSITEGEWSGRIRALYVAAADTLCPLPGALDAIAALKAAGVRQVCVSNSERDVVDANLAALGVLPMIDFSISVDDVASGKPDPEPYRIAAERLGLAPGEVAAVEDSATGAASARAAGLIVYGVLPRGEIPGAHLTVPTIADLVTHLLPPAGR